MDKLLFMVPNQDSVNKNHPSLTFDGKMIKVFKDGAYEEFTVEEAQEKMKPIYEAMDYVVYQNAPVREFLSNFDYILDTFDEYKTPELGAIYTDFYKNGQSINKHEYLRSFTPDSFVMNIPPVVIVNKKYLPGLPLVLNQELAGHLVNSAPIMHIPEATYILD